MIYKETTSTGELLVYMNGELLYKRWPNGQSILFEKYGPPTRKPIGTQATINNQYD